MVVLEIAVALQAVTADEIGHFRAYCSIFLKEPD
jgi:hypothetical protein